MWFEIEIEEGVLEKPAMTRKRKEAAKTTRPVLNVCKIINKRGSTGGVGV